MTSEYRLKEDNKILIVDDDNVNQMLIRKMLDSVGANTFTAFDGKEAVDMAQGKDFDLIFMDIQMPVMDGYDATKSLRNQGFKKPILALSADLTSEDREKCLRVGMNDFLMKPFQKKRLIDLLKEWIPD